MYILQDIRTGKFVSYPGSQSSFTRDLRSAQTFPTKEAAERAACPESERPINISTLLRRRSH